MSRLIDAERLECHWIIRSDGSRVYACHAEDIENAPTVDAVEVVRCKDCGHYCLTDAAGGKYCEILRLESPIESGYCCYGERKDNG